MQTKRGEVDYTKPPAAPVSAAVPQPLDVKDRLAVGESSWAILRFQDASELKVRELTELEIVEPTVARGSTFRLLKGEVYFSGLQRSRDTVVSTPHVQIVPRGTEFLIRVTDHETEVVMFDGQADLSNAQGNLLVNSGDWGLAEPGRPPRLRPAVEGRNLVQWWLYYPGVLDPADLGLSTTAQRDLASSLGAYRAGNLIAALERFPGFPTPPVPATDREKLYLAGLFLAAGAIDRAQALMTPAATTNRTCFALREIISAVRFTNLTGYPAPQSASEWLAHSYLRQAAHDLPGALKAAQEAVSQSPNFAFALERVAELEFGFGQIRAAQDALDRSLKLAPENGQGLALRGFLLSSENRPEAAEGAFADAIRLDPGLANGWLGRGLVRIRMGRSEDGLADLQTAASLEPNRSFLRSYLGKAYFQAGKWASVSHRKDLLRKTREELALAKELDPKDPTAWLYSALVDRDENRFNEAVQELERSAELNDNRQVYRSAFLLDQDRAVRSSSLAGVYQAAGLNDVSFSEAARAVNDDYTNPSAHMFVSDSYNLLRDPTRFNLRYETPWFSERLLAYLLGPIGSTPLSQNVTQQEYARLFEGNHLGFNSLSEYRSDGQYHEQASQFGLIDGTTYALDLDYQHNNGVRPNNRLDRIEWYSAINQQLGPNDSLFLQAKYLDLSGGDNFQYLDPRQADPNFKLQEFQQPTVVAGFHHQWAPGVHTLLLAGRLTDEQHISDLNVPRPVVNRNALNQITGVSSMPFDQRYESDFAAYLGELNQIFQTDRQRLILGARVQQGTFKISNALVSSPGTVSFPGTSATVEDDFARVSGYGYYTIEALEHLYLTAGMSYDTVTVPANIRLTPVSEGESDRASFNPKAAVAWNPSAQITFRGAYTRSLGGVSYDESYRLEPTQLAGFNQSFRSIISESLVGPVAAPQYQTGGAAMEVKLKTSTYAGLDFQWLSAGVHRQRGDFELLPTSASPITSSLAQRLDYDERSAGIWLNQLLSEEWSLGMRYQFTRSDLRTALPEVPVAVLGTAETSQRSDLHRIQVFGRFQHPSGVFVRAEWDWYRQDNSEKHFALGTPVQAQLPGDTFGQGNFFLGYRFPRQLGEVSLGVLNVGGGDYRLDPLNVYTELPRERVWTARLLLNF